MRLASTQILVTGGTIECIVTPTATNLQKVSIIHYLIVHQKIS